ncbi:hypothetical protein C3B47_06440 [Flavobacterium columnare]|nr:hypothetical protein [Flavobacterium columnare]MBF6655546.1 hypothetical protein [Flavobacterium columnare]MBF6658401.1 hypothetical protein [Flavobacterium columnare]PTD14840.1 hypothetical protein C6N29_10515 [Flavobacterium columnare]
MIQIKHNAFLNGYLTYLQKGNSFRLNVKQHKVYYFGVIFISIDGGIYFFKSFFVETNTR